MITTANRIFVNPDHAKAFEDRFTNRQSHLESVPGFISNQVLKPTQPNDPYIVLTFWESMEAFEAWTTSEAFKKGHAGTSTLPEGIFTKQNQVEVHEIIAQLKK